MIISIRRSDGGVSIMTLVDGADAATQVAKWERGNGRGWTSLGWREVTAADLPADRTDRDAWQDSGSAVAVNAVRKAALADAEKNRKIDGLQSDALIALSTALFEIMKGTVAIPQPSLTAAQFKAYLKSKLP